MIYELEKNQFNICKDLVNRSINIEEKAIVAGINPGRVFVDDVKQPRSALIWQGNDDGFIFVGDAKNKAFNSTITKYIDDVIAIEARSRRVEWFECIGNHQSWYTTFSEIFADRSLQSWDQNVYLLNVQSFQSQQQQQLEDEDYTVVMITEEFLRDPSTTNMAFVQTKLTQFWGEEAQFLQAGIGFCVLHQQHIVSICMTGYRYQEYHGIDIETIPSYQGKKLAQRATYRFVSYCLVHHFKPYWDCMEVNHPSNAVARKIGFVKEVGYKGYEFKL